MLIKFQKMLYVESNNFHLFGKPTRDMTEFEVVKRILFMLDMYDSVPIFSLVCYFPPRHQNNKKRACKFKKIWVLEYAEIFKNV